MGGCCSSKVLPDGAVVPGAQPMGGAESQTDAAAKRGAPNRVLSLGRFNAEGFEPTVVSPKGGGAQGRSAGLDTVPEEDLIKPVSSESAVKVAIAVSG